MDDNPGKISRDPGKMPLEESHPDLLKMIRDRGPMPRDPDAYKAYMDRLFEETKFTSPWYAYYGARKAASDAKKKAAAGSEAAVPLQAVSASSSTAVATSSREAALVAEKEPTEKRTAGSEAVISPKAVSASSPDTIIISDSDDPEVSLSAWKPRKSRVKKEPTPIEGSSSVNEGITPAASTAKTPARGGTGVARTAGSDARDVSSAEAKNKSRRQSSASGAVKGEDGEKPTHQVKRPVESDHNDGRLSAAKKARESSSASSSPALPTRRTGADREPPAWYKQLPKPKGDRARNQSDAEIAILRLKTSINRVKVAQNSLLALAKEVDEIVERLHALIFLLVDGKLLRQTRMLDNKDGLPQLFDSAFTDGVDWPWYVKADAEELYNKWYTGEFETDLYRGITRGLPAKKGKGKAKADDSVADRLAEGHEGHERFKLMGPKQHGNGLLLNGAWWPTQLAVFRDGGHGATQSGITGNPTSGAYSVIMAGGVDPSGQPYPNEDRGSEVLYCGTDNKDKTQNKPSPDTASLLTNHRTKQPVRLFRSHNLGSSFAPELGFRYDGLYDVASYEDMDPPDNKRRRHRFKLVRRAGQDPIRSEGAGKRPTKQEIDEYEKDKKNRGR
jgi:hypothetical protein